LAALRSGAAIALSTLLPAHVKCGSAGQKRASQNAANASFDFDIVEMLIKVLDDAWSRLPAGKTGSAAARFGKQRAAREGAEQPR
jgi:hypothetical protein